MNLTEQLREALQVIESLQAELAEVTGGQVHIEIGIHKAPAPVIEAAQQLGLKPGKAIGSHNRLDWLTTGSEAELTIYRGER